MRSCKIELGNAVETVVYGEVISTYAWRTLFAKKKSIRQSEFYDAANAGLKPELTFEIYSFEYNNDEKLKLEDKEYMILRTYEKGEKIELTVSTQVGGEV